MKFRIGETVKLREDLSDSKAEFSGKQLVVRAIDNGRYIMKSPKENATILNRKLMDIPFSEYDIQLNPMDVRINKHDDIIDIEALNDNNEWKPILRLQDGEFMRQKDLNRLGFTGLSLDFKGRLRLATVG